MEGDGVSQGLVLCQAWPHGLKEMTAQSGSRVSNNLPVDISRNICMITVNHSDMSNVFDTLSPGLIGSSCGIQKNRVKEAVILLSISGYQQL